MDGSVEKTPKVAEDLEASSIQAHLLAVPIDCTDISNKLPELCPEQPTNIASDHESDIGNESDIGVEIGAL